MELLMLSPMSPKPDLIMISAVPEMESEPRQADTT